MATTLNPPIASVDAAGDVVSLDFSGTCDQCSDLRIEVSDPNSGDILCTGPVVFNGSNWSKTFSAPGDFEALDFACDKDVQVTSQVPRHHTFPDFTYARSHGQLHGLFADD